MEQTDRKIWFPAKKCGWGWGPPSCWQGWLVVALWLLLLLAGARLVIYAPLLFAIYTLVLSAVLVLICWLKGEKPKWRWEKE